MAKYTTIGFSNGKKRQDSTNDYSIAVDRLSNYKKGFIQLNLPSGEKLRFNKKGFKEAQ